MIGYRYDSDGYLLGQVEVQESPLEPGVFLIPPNTSMITPPSTPENTALKWDGLKWVTVPNYSGIPYYKKSDKSIKYFVVGELPSNGYTKVTPPIPDYSYIIWNEYTDSWVVDTKLKSDYDKDLCKQAAKGKISAYDWIMDETTTPKLLNKQDFYDYRSKLRLLILNPVENPTWPEIPQEVWGNE